jgi:hypothetical protein
MKFVISESQLKRLTEEEEISPRLIVVINNMVNQILTDLRTKETYKKSEIIDIHEYNNYEIVIGYGNDILTFEYDNTMDEAPYYRPGTYDDPPEGSDGYWHLEAKTLKYEKLFEDDFITVYEGKDFTRFIKDLPEWLFENIQDLLRRNYGDDYDYD